LLIRRDIAELKRPLAPPGERAEETLRDIRENFRGLMNEINVLQEILQNIHKDVRGSMNDGTDLHEILRNIHNDIRGSMDEVKVLQEILRMNSRTYLHEILLELRLLTHGLTTQRAFAQLSPTVLVNRAPSEVLLRERVQAKFLRSTLRNIPSPFQELD
jgi:hypothetical protein